MVTETCPWCETDLRMEPSELDAPEATCDECSTSWLLGDGQAEPALALAA